MLTPFAPEGAELADVDLVNGRALYVRLPAAPLRGEDIEIEVAVARFGECE